MTALQIVSGAYRAAEDSNRSLRSRQQGKPFDGPAERAILDGIYARARAIDANERIGFAKAYARSFQELVPPLDNAQAAAVSAYSVLDYYGGPGVLGAGEKVDAKPEDYLDLKWWEETYADVDKESIEASGVIIEGIAGTFFSQARLDGFNGVIEQYPNVKILGKPIAADWNREKGVAAAEDFLSRYSPDEMQFMWAASNEMGLGAIAASERKGVLSTAGGTKEPEDGKVAIFTNDVTPESTDAIRGGKLAAETHHGFPEWGWFGTQFAVQLACGQSVPETEDIRPRSVYQGNADQFYPDPQLPPIDWDTIKQDCEE